jgi:uncharacterized membrane protein YhaH (DUF805 family)
MMESIRHNLSALLRFSGRDPRRLFWPYAAAICLLSWFAIYAVMAPQILGAVGRIQRFAREHPELTTVESGPGHYSVSVRGAPPELMPDMLGMIYGIAPVMAVTVLLLAAAVARRLHDRGRTGAWGLVPVALLLTGFFGMSKIFAGVGSGIPPDPRLFLAIFLNNAAYLASLVFLVIQLASAGTSGSNRFGPEPAQTAGPNG